MKTFVLLVTWLVLEQPPQSSQTTFNSAEACEQPAMPFLRMLNGFRKNFTAVGMYCPLSQPSASLNNSNRDTTAPRRFLTVHSGRDVPENARQGTIAVPWHSFSAAPRAIARMLPMARTATPRKAAQPKSSRRRPARRKGVDYWSGRVTRESNALDLEAGVFQLERPETHRRVAQAVGGKEPAAQGRPYRSALSMLVFYINRAGRNLPAGRKRTLEQAKVELRKQFGRD